MSDAGHVCYSHSTASGGVVRETTPLRRLQFEHVLIRQQDGSADTGRLMHWDGHTATFEIDGDEAPVLSLFPRDIDELVALERPLSVDEACAALRAAALGDSDMPLENLDLVFEVPGRGRIWLRTEPFAPW